MRITGMFSKDDVMVFINVASSLDDNKHGK